MKGHIIDNAVSPEDLNLIRESILTKLNYKPHYSVEAFGMMNMMAAEISLEECPEFNKIIECVVTKKLLCDPIPIRRVYANANASGELHGGVTHVDDGKITILFYPFEWTDVFGGGTLVNGELIDYVPNRIIVFDAEMPHRAMPHCNHANFRYTIAFKTEATWR